MRLAVYGIDLIGAALAAKSNLWYLPFVQAKETVQSLLESLPDDCSIDDVLYHLYVIQVVERGRADAEAGRLISHQAVAEEMRQKWQVGREL